MPHIREADRLNPCFNGILKYMFNAINEGLALCLNPCFNGILKYSYADTDTWK